MLLYRVRCGFRCCCVDVGIGRSGVTGNRTVLNNTLNARDGRYPRATAPNNRVQPYITYMYYNIITVLRVRKNTQTV